MIYQSTWCKAQGYNPHLIKNQECLKHNLSKDHLWEGKNYIVGIVEKMDMVCIFVPTQEEILEIQEVLEDR